MFTMSLAHVGMGIRVNALCPEYVDTPLLESVPSFVFDSVRDNLGFVEMEKVVAGKHRHHSTSFHSSRLMWLLRRFNLQIHIEVLWTSLSENSFVSRCILPAGRWKQSGRMSVGSGQPTHRSLAWWGNQKQAPAFHEGRVGLHWPHRLATVVLTSIDKLLQRQDLRRCCCLISVIHTDPGTLDCLICFH